MSTTTAKIITPPTVSDATWAAYATVTKGKAFAAVFALDADESEIIVKATVEASPSGGQWPALRQNFGPQEVVWAAISFPYTTSSGGQRSKFLFVTWVPDTLTRSTFKETVRLKSGGVMLAAELHQAAARDGGKKYQANGDADLEIWEVLKTVAKFERDGVDRASIEALL